MSTSGRRRDFAQRNFGPLHGVTSLERDTGKQGIVLSLHPRHRQASSATSISSCNCMFDIYMKLGIIVFTHTEYCIALLLFVSGRGLAKFRRGSFISNGRSTVILISHAWRLFSEQTDRPRACVVGFAQSVWLRMPAQKALDTKAWHNCSHSPTLFISKRSETYLSTWREFRICRLINSRSS